MKLPPLKKFTLHNVLVKWPSILFQRFTEKYIRRSFLGGMLFTNKPVILTDAYGMRFVLYPWTHEPLEKLLTRRYLADEFEAISRLIKKGDTIIDVGANIGTHAVHMSKKIGSTGKIYCFEPVEETSWYLKENLVLNHTENVEVTTAALKEKDGVEKMHIFPTDFSEWNSFGIPETNEAKPTATVDVMTMKLDTFVVSKNIRHIDFLKIDAEGSEKDVFRGASNLLKDGSIDILSFEVSQAPLKGMGSTAKELFDILESYRYFVYEYSLGKKRFIGPIKDSNFQYGNYYASRKDLSLL